MTDTTQPPADDFRGDTTALIASINALLALEDAKALVPHPLGGTGSHAYRLLNAARHRLAALTRRAGGDAIPAGGEERSADEAVNFLFDRLAAKLDLEEWQVVEGSEEWEGDVSATLHRLLIDAGIIDDETGAVASFATPKPPAGGDAGADAADILDHYARFIRDEVKADDFERHPYLPHIEQVAADLRAALALPAPVVEGWQPKIGDPVKVSNGQPYSSDWRDTDLWIAGLAIDDYARGINVTVSEVWPVPSRHSSRYRGLTDGFLIQRTDCKPDDLEPRAALSEGRSHG